MPNPLLIVGACVRQHVESARLAGLEPIGVDLFGDWDTRQAGRCIQVNSFEEVSAILSQTPGPWCLAGGLENHLDQLFTEETIRRFLGPKPQALRLANDIEQWKPLVQECGFQVPAVLLSPRCPPGDWICKPATASGGHGIQPATTGDRRSTGKYFQARVDGPSLSGLFTTSPAGSHLLGTTWQLLGRDLDSAAPPFAYAGSIGPLKLDVKLEAQLKNFGQQ
ncbi:MAG: hypothetical protein MK108_12895, partial [Mariniblastus sp.]|nr:hypothetical protein [Mariniblastus sp.]